MTDVSNSAGMLDIRDIIERYEELEGEHQNLVETLADGEDDTSLPEIAQEAKENLAKWDEDNADEFATLKSLLDDLKGNGGDHQWRGDWYPITLIRDSYWMDYTEETADDFHGEAMQEARWPLNCIDWEKAAEELQMDYTSVEFDGVTYWYR